MLALSHLDVLPPYGQPYGHRLMLVINCDHLSELSTILTQYCISCNMVQRCKNK